VVKGLCILVVDDSALSRGLTCDAIRLSGVPIEALAEAGDGAEALEILAQRHVDVVITDVQMPRVDGVELVAQIALKPELVNARIVTMTAETTGSHALRVAGMRVHARLIKPVRFDAIRTILGEIWRDRHA
jgi:two-component system, chemotaxis family, chemotaxis protein CheY